MISKAQTEPIKPLRSFSDASHRDLKEWWQMVVNSQDVFLEPAAWSWGKPKKQQKYNNIATTHLHSCTAKIGSYARAQVTIIVYIWCITKGCQGTAMFWMAYLSPEHSNYPINILRIYTYIYINICLWEKMYMWNAIHTCHIYKNMYRIIAFINVVDEVHPYNCSNRQRTTNLAEEGTSTSTLWLTSFIAVLLDLHKPPTDPPLEPLK